MTAKLYHIAGWGKEIERNLPSMSVKRRVDLPGPGGDDEDDGDSPKIWTINDFIEPDQNRMR